MTITYKHSPTAGANVKFPNADITLSDGVTTLGLRLCNAKGEHDPLAFKHQPLPTTTLRTGSGAPGYSDLEPPFTAYLQDDWSGGLGNREFDRDSTRFLEAYNVDTTKAGRIILGPKKQTQTGVSGGTLATTGAPDTGSTYVIYSGPGGGGSSFSSSQIVPSSTISVKSIRFYAQAQALNMSMNINVYGDDGGDPDVTSGVLASGSYVFTDTEMQLRDIPLNISLTASTTYHIAFVPGGTGSVLSITLYKNNSAGKIQSTSIELSMPPTITTTDVDADSRISFSLSGDSMGEMRFFEYKGALYAVTKPDYSEAPKLFCNGLRGVAESNSSDLSKTEVESGITLTADAHIGKIIKIVAGTGSTEEVPWRQIIDNDTDSITVSPNWTISQDNTTEFVILGEDTWYEITGHGLTKPVTDVLVVDSYVYFAQGEGTAIRRMKGEASGGAWTRTWAADGSNKAYHLELLVNTNGRYIYKSLPSSIQVDKAAVATSWADLSFSGAIKCGSANTRITNLINYGEDGELYVLKEDEIGRINSDDKYITLPISEMRNVASWRNGKAALHHGVYLWLSMLDGYLERYYEGRLDDYGPNRDEGLPSGYEGVVAHLVGFPGRFFAAINAGAYGYSSVLCQNGTGWHPIYVSDTLGGRINQLHIQSIPGDPERFRLWVAQETNIFALPLALDPLKDSEYEYTSSGHLVSSWFYGGMKDLRKFWHSLSVFAENLSSDHYYSKVYYQVDTETSWTEIGTYDTEPLEEIDISEDDDVTGRRFRYKIELSTDDDGETPEVQAVLIDVVERVPPKDGFQIRFLVEDTERDLNGNITGLSAKDVRDQLNTWRDSRLTPAPLTLRYNHELFDNKRVFIDPAPLLPFAYVHDPQAPAGGLRLIGSLNMTEV